MVSLFISVQEIWSSSKNLVHLHSSYPCRTFKKMQRTEPNGANSRQFSRHRRPSNRKLQSPIPSRDASSNLKPSIIILSHHGGQLRQTTEVEFCWNAVCSPRSECFPIHLLRLWWVTPWFKEKQMSPPPYSIWAEMLESGYCLHGKIIDKISCSK